MTEPRLAPRPARWQRWFASAAWAVSGLLALFALVRFSIGWVFPVASSSM